jgi:preprotein translocase subunit SecF
MLKLPLHLVPYNTKIDFIGKKWISFAFSIFITVATVMLLFTKGLNLGIDFTGGIIIESRTEHEIDVSKYRDVLIEAGYHGASVQNFGSNNGVLLRFQAKDSDAQAKEVEVVKNLLKEKIDNKIEFRKIDYVGPKVGKELIEKGVKALILALLVMLVYIWFRFSWQFGLGAVIALFHDAIATIGFYIVSGYEFDLTSIAAVLTIIGYSINDTVVIYDRIRENMRKYKIKHLAEIINLSVNETLSRTVMTVSTCLLVCLAFVLFGGEVIEGFSMAMLFGIAFGTYSSVYIAAPVLMYTGIAKAAAHQQQ